MKHIVKFEFCKYCAYYNDGDETKDPCPECLAESVIEDSRMPSKYKENDTKISHKKLFDK